MAIIIAHETPAHFAQTYSARVSGVLCSSSERPASSSRITESPAMSAAKNGYTKNPLIANVGDSAYTEFATARTGASMSLKCVGTSRSGEYTRTR